MFSVASCSVEMALSCLAIHTSHPDSHYPVALDAGKQNMTDCLVINCQMIIKLCVYPRGHFSLSSDAISTGFVPDGSSCGTNLACLNRQCVSSSSLTTFTCPVGSNGQRCSGNGVRKGFSWLAPSLTSACESTGSVETELSFAAMQQQWRLFL